jgi:hypothetical protein
VVVDLTVVGDPHAAILVGHRLFASRADVDDGKTAMCEAGRPVVKETSPVGTAMAQHITHPAKSVNLDRLTWIEVNDASKTAHKLVRRFVGSWVRGFEVLGSDDEYVCLVDEDGFAAIFKLEADWEIAIVEERRHERYNV